MRTLNLILKISAVILLFSFGKSEGQLRLTLDEAILCARTNSVDAAVALDELRTGYWEYRTYRAELLPELTLTGTVPSYHKQYSTYMNAEGNYSFVANNYFEINGGLSLSQRIWPTGGTLSVNTSADWLRQLSGDSYNRYMSIPVALTLQQPVFGVNTIRWDRRIEPVRYSEAKAAFLSATEDVAIQVTGLYFTLLMARENRDIARQNLSNAEKLYEVAVEKRNMGQISRNDLLQMELNVLNAQSELTERDSDLRSAMFQLCAFLDIDSATDVEPVIPDAVPNVEIGFDEALEKALTNNKFAKNQLRVQLEADYAVAQAKGDLRQIELFAQIGFTGTASHFGDAYRGLRDNQVVEIGISIPLIDWGKRRGRVKVAESNRNVTASRLRQEAMRFSQELFLLVERYGNQRRQLELSARADTIAARRYATNVETYMIGRLSTLDLNDSRVKKDESRREYVNELYLYWLYYYQLRSLTLWDFTRGCGIDADIEALVRR